MYDAMESVRDFHVKHEFTVDADLTKTSSESVTMLLITAASSLAGIAGGFEEECKHKFDDRLLRAHLILEETAEAIKGLAIRDEVELLDGLADSIYVLVGTAVAFDLPLPEAFKEVCWSNMTKDTRRDTVADIRLRKKGDSFQPPKLKQILEGHHEARKLR